MMNNKLQICEGSILGKSHRVEAFLGEGGFGIVTKCRNTKTDKKAAIKINKNHPEVVRQTKLEISILKKLRRLSPETCNIVRWDGFFFDKDRVCLDFELLDQSLYHYMKDRNNVGLPMTEVRPVLHQLTTALSHLKSIGIVHADLKPDNVMVVDRHQKPLKVKVIDFGLARPVTAVVPGVCVQTLWYRAPEVMLHIPFDEAIDMWSLGLVAAELATGFPLYPGEVEYDVLCNIIETQGQPADDVLDRGSGTGYYFQLQDNNQQQCWRFKSPQQFEYETGFQATDARFARLGSLDDLELHMDDRHQSDRHWLVDLIKRMLHLDPQTRIKPQEVLEHPFFVPSHPQNYPADVVIDTTDIEDAEPELPQQPENYPADVMTDIEDAEPELPQQPENYPADVVIDMTDIEDAEPELPQQPENYPADVVIDMTDIEDADPELPADVVIDMTDIEDAEPELHADVVIDMTDIEVAEPELHADVVIDMTDIEVAEPELHADVVIDMTDIEVAEPEFPHQPENSFTRTTASLPEETEERADDQLEDNAENGGWLQYFLKKISDVFSFIFYGG